MIEKLNSIFHSATECRERGYPCAMAKKNVKKFYKPDDGIKDKDLEQKLFTEHPPMLSDCVAVYDESKVAIIEIKCAKVTNSIIKGVIKKLTNTSKIITNKEVVVTKYMLLYKKFEDKQINKILSTKRIDGKPIISKKYENKAIAI
ncbi:hypothetical protein [Sulfurimonas sp.]|uniref:hypothetical protein n=1 Tax=Sulfurimonas sp. TaxID=2022749 RepID=UPI002B498059|nr:hypothetical protein [Sulfurimonas sp.]